MLSVEYLEEVIVRVHNHIDYMEHSCMEFKPIIVDTEILQMVIGIQTALQIMNLESSSLYLLEIHKNIEKLSQSLSKAKYDEILQGRYWLVSSEMEILRKALEVMEGRFNGENLLKTW